MKKTAETKVTITCPKCGLKQTWSEGKFSGYKCEGSQCEANCIDLIEAALRTRVASRNKRARTEATWAERGDHRAAEKFPQLLASVQAARALLAEVRVDMLATSRRADRIAYMIQATT